MSIRLVPMALTVLVSGVLYSLLFVAVYPVTGQGIAALAVVPIALIGWRWGAWAGLATGVVFFALHIGLAGWVGVEPGVLVFRNPGAYASLVLGLGSGALRSILERLRASEARYRNLVELTPLGVLVQDPQRVLYANPAAARLLGVDTPKSLVGQSPMELVSAASQADLRDQLEALASNRVQPVAGELELMRRDGATLATQAVASRIVYGGKPALQLLLRDLDQERKLQTQVDYLTYRDPVSGLPNRQALQETATRVLSLALRQGWSVGLLKLELDGFEVVTRALGQSAGDQLLRRVSQRLQNTLRREDTLAHFGGERFCILAQPLSESEAPGLVERVLAVFQRPFALDDLSVHLKASLGVAFFPQDGAEIDDLLTKANTALHRARASGQGVIFFDPNLPEATPERLRLEGELRSALQQGGLTLFYQPVFDLHSGQPQGVEALIRWPHPERGMVSPGDFIPLAEERGFIAQVDRYVLRQALADAPRLSGWIAVNLSAQSFLDPSFLPFLEGLLAERRVPGDRLVLEITERLLAEPRRAQPVLEAIQALGVSIAVDDFGTGYSSLAYLRAFPLDHLKVDRSFVLGIGRDPKDEAVARSILQLAASLDLSTIAEGVETQEQLDWLRQEGCAMAQGFLLGRPRPLEG